MLKRRGKREPFPTQILSLRRKREKIRRHVCRGTCVRIPGRIIKLEDSKGLIDGTSCKRRRMSCTGANSVTKLITPLALNRSYAKNTRRESRRIVGVAELLSTTGCCGVCEKILVVPLWY